MSTVLDDCLSAETAEAVLEQLLAITDTDLASVWQLACGRSLGVLRELWRRWREEGEVCAVVVRVFVQLVTSGSGASGEWGEMREGVREFSLSLAKHGE